MTRAVRWSVSPLLLLSGACPRPAPPPPAPAEVEPPVASLSCDALRVAFDTLVRDRSFCSVDAECEPVAAGGCGCAEALGGQGVGLRRDVAPRGMAMIRRFEALACARRFDRCDLNRRPNHIACKAGRCVAWADVPYCNAIVLPQ